MWQKGQSGNPDGPRKQKLFEAALQRAIAQDDGKRLRATAEKLLDEAAKGEPWAVRELADRLDGKPHQSVSGENGGPIRFELIAPWMAQSVADRNG